MCTRDYERWKKHGTPAAPVRLTPEESLERQRAAGRANYWRYREAARARAKVYYAANREATLERGRRYNAEHREKVSEANRRWRLANPERMVELRQRWGKENPERVRQNGANKYARRKARKVQTSFETVDYSAILAKHGWHCYLCDNAIGTKAELHFDHIIPLAKGGPHVATNIRPTHAVCNARKGAKVLCPFLILDRGHPGTLLACMTPWLRGVPGTQGMPTP
jgi:5-methylcytosine-specific restriction endonuclease McrA